MTFRLTNSPIKLVLSIALGLFALSSNHALASARTWKNTGTDFNTAANWNTTTPGVGDVAEFTSGVVMQPNLSASLSIAGIYFMGATTSGYDITNSNSATFTLTGYSTSGSGGTSDSSAAAIRSDITSGTNTIEVPIILVPSSTSQSNFVQAVGGTLILNGAISSGAGINLSLRGGGTIQLNGANSFATGSIDTASEVVVVGNNSGLGNGTFTIGATSTLQAGGGARTVANNLVVAGNTTINGSNAFTFNGSVTSSGSSSRTLTVSNTGGTTFGGSVFLQEATASGRTLTINGTSAVAINGVVQDGGTGPATLKYSGSNTLTLNNTNTYSGGTQLTISGGTLVASHDGALGTGNVSLTTGNLTLTLSGGVTQQYMSTGTNLSIQNTDVVNLNFVGTNVINALFVDGVEQAAGVYGASVTDPDGDFLGTGLIMTLVPEPSVYMLLGIGLLVCAQRFLRGRNSA